MQMLKGEFPDECNYCWNIEKVGEWSDRIHKSAAGWARPFLGEVNANRSSREVLPTYLEVAFDNICNLKCAYCSPVYSSSWESEIRAFGPYPTLLKFNNLEMFRIQKAEPLSPTARVRYNEAFWKWWPTFSPTLEHLRITGGEPLLTGGIWKVLDALIETPNPKLILSVNSNLSVPVQLVDRLIGKINVLKGKVAKVTIFCSIDSVGAQAEYIRFGLNYKVFMANVTKLLTECEAPLNVSFMITVNALSLPGMKSLIREIHQLRVQYPEHEIGLDTPYLNHPEHLSVRLLPSFAQKFLTECVQEMRALNFTEDEVQRVERILKLMKDEPYRIFKKWQFRKDLIRFLQEYDRRKGTNCFATFPEYKLFFKECERAWSPPQSIRDVIHSGLFKGWFMVSRLKGIFSPKLLK